jgi:RNA polymerase sigma-70 factor (ECF subfamily)
MTRVAQNARSLRIEELLTHSAWVQRLARSLVINDDRIDDVAQETWLHALRAPPTADINGRGWLTRVAQNVARKLARSELRRRRHEAHAPSPQPLPSPEQALERATLQRCVVDAVMALDDLYRDAILLRFFEGLPPADIARSLGVPLETVRTRIKRGLILLRGRLDAEFGTDGREGISALTPLLMLGGKAPVAIATGSVGGGGTSTLIGGGIIGLLLGGAFMSKLSKVAVGIVVAGVTCLGTYKIWIEPRSHSSRLNNNTMHPPEFARPETAAPPKTEPAAATRESIDRKTAERPTVPVALGAIDGSVLDGSVRPIAGATVVLGQRTNEWFESLHAFRSAHRAFDPNDATEHTWRITTSAADGSFHFDALESQVQWALGAIHDPIGTGWTDQVAFSGDPARARVVITLEAGVVVFGVVRDPLGQAVAAATISFDGAIDKPSDTRFGFWGQLSDSEVTAEDGSFRSLSLPWRFARMHVIAHRRPELSQLQTQYEELPAGANEMRRDLTIPALTVLRGRIIGPDGGPAHLAQMVVPKLGADINRTQGHGTVAVAAFAEDPRLKPELIATLFTNDPGQISADPDHAYGTLAIDEDRYEIPLRSTLLRFVAVIARDRLLGVAEIPNPPSRLDVVIDPSLVPDQSLVHGLRLHFCDGRDGSPLEGVVVSGAAIVRDANGQLYIEKLRFGSPKELFPDRELELPRMPCSITMRHQGFVTRSVLIDASRSGAPTELTFDFNPAGGPLIVRVVDEGNAPIASARTRIYRATDHEAVLVENDRSTDEFGESRLTGIPTGSVIVVVQKDGFAPVSASISIGDDDNTVDLVMAKGYEVTLNARSADGTPARYGQLYITNEAGIPLFDHFRFDSGPTLLSNVRFRLIDGTYTVRCLLPAGDGGTKTFVAAPAASVDLVLAPIHQ